MCGGAFQNAVQGELILDSPHWLIVYIEIYMLQALCYISNYPI